MFSPDSLFKGFHPDYDSFYTVPWEALREIHSIKDAMDSYEVVIGDFIVEDINAFQDNLLSGYIPLSTHLRIELKTRVLNNILLKYFGLGVISFVIVLVMMFQFGFKNMEPQNIMTGTILSFIPILFFGIVGIFQNSRYSKEAISYYDVEEVKLSELYSILDSSNQEILRNWLSIVRGMRSDVLQITTFDNLSPDVVLFLRDSSEFVEGIRYAYNNVSNINSLQKRYLYLRKQYQSLTDGIY